MKDEKVETALTQHLAMKDGGDVSKCLFCPLFNEYKTCPDRLIFEASELIKRLKNKVGRLERENERLTKELRNG